MLAFLARLSARDWVLEDVM